jgi:hypothetical protein
MIMMIPRTIHFVFLLLNSPVFVDAVVRWVIVVALRWGNRLATYGDGVHISMEANLTFVYIYAGKEKGGASLVTGSPPVDVIRLHGAFL